MPHAFNKKPDGFYYCSFCNVASLDGASSEACKNSLSGDPIAQFRQLVSLSFEAYRPKDGDSSCGKKLDCGGSCCLPPQHAGLCECVGDTPGDPGSCPA